MRRLKILVFFIVLFFLLIPSFSFAYDCSGFPLQELTGVNHDESSLLSKDFKYNNTAYIVDEDHGDMLTMCVSDTTRWSYSVNGGIYEWYRPFVGASCPANQYRVYRYRFPVLTDTCTNPEDAPPPPPPTEPITCSNGLADTNENGIDCGGVCAAVCEQVCPEGFNLILNVQTGADECSKIADADQWGQCPMGWVVHPANGTAAPWCELIVPSVPGKADEFAAQPDAASATPPEPQTSTGSTSTVVTNNTTNNTSTVTTTTTHKSYGGNVTTTTTVNTYSGPDGTGQLTSSITESKTGAASPTDATQGTDSSSYSSPGESSPYGDGSAFDVGQRFQSFVGIIQSSALFSMAGGFAAGIPSGGESTYSFSGGRYGQHTFDFSRFSSVFTMIRALYLIMCSWVAIKIVTLKGGSQ